MPIEPKSPCECGEPLPWHLFTLAFGMSHICSCERKYEEKAGVVELAGTAPNPFARYDAAQAKDSLPQDTCPCGKHLPARLFSGKPTAAHTCSCGQVFRATADTVTQDGPEGPEIVVRYAEGWVFSRQKGGSRREDGLWFTTSLQSGVGPQEPEWVWLVHFPNEDLPPVWLDPVKRSCPTPKDVELYCDNNFPIGTV